MNPLTSDVFRDLFSARGTTCLTIYMPTASGPRSGESNRIQFKNLIDDAERRLLERHQKARVDSILDPVRRLSTEMFWAHQQHGLAVFATETLERHILLTTSVEPLVIVSDSFHVRPLLRSLQSNQRYNFLGLSKRHVRFYRGSRDGLVPAALPGLPHVIADAAPASASGVGALYAHHGVPSGAGPEGLQRYFRAVDHAVFQVLQNEKTPLLVALPDEYVSEWRKVQRYPYALETYLQGNFEGESVAELHRRAWPMIEAALQTRQEKHLVDFGNQKACGKASTDLASIAKAASQGRVSDLLIADGERLHGWLDQETGKVSIDRAPRQGDDLYDDLAECVLLRGGEVHGYPRKRMPSESAIAAVLRW